MDNQTQVSKVSIVGAGMVSAPGITYKMFRGLSDEKIKRGVFLAQTAATEADQTLSVADREMLAQAKKDGLNLYDTIINTYNTLTKMNKQVRDLACTPGL